MIVTGPVRPPVDSADFILSLAFFPLALIMVYVLQDRSGLAAA